MSRSHGKRLGISDVLDERFVTFSRKALIASLVLHLCVPLGVIVLTGLDKLGVHILPEPKKLEKKVYQEFIQVDMVGLPDALLKDLDKLDTTEPVVEKPKADLAEKPLAEQDAMTEAAKEQEMAEKLKAEKAKAAKEAKELKEKEKKQKAEKEKALKKLQEEASREAALKALAKKEGQKGRSKTAGNILSKGTSTTGAIGDAKDRYMSLLVQKIKQHFSIFSWQRKKGLVAVVYLELYPTGRVRKKEILKKSIDPLYDSAVLQAVDDAQPLPVPDDASLLHQGITVEFRHDGN